MKKAILSILALVIALSMVLSGCNNGGDPGASGAPKTPGEGEIWYADTAETILLDKDISNYQSVKKAASITVDAARNDDEGAQIFITASKTINNYDIIKSDLQNANGTKFSKDNINLFVYKYVKTTFNVQSSRKIGVGYYPDGVLPFEASKKFGENTVKEGQNQGVYVRFDVPMDCEPGTYTGNIVVDLDGKKTNVPVTLNVWDVAVPYENSLKTAFLCGWNWATPEFDGTYEKYMDYSEMLTQYRLSTIFVIPKSVSATSEEFARDYYAERVYEHVQNPINTAYAINVFEEAMSSYRVDMMVMYLRVLAEKSFEKKQNILKQGYFYFNTIIDEATMQGKFNETKATTDAYREAIVEAGRVIRANKAQYMEEYGVDEDFVEELAVTAENVPHLFVSNYDASYAPLIDEDTIGTGLWCPNIWEYQNREYEKFYTEELKVDWWYGCGGSSRLIPCLQMDDYTLSPRLQSWLQLHYGITGYLYWGVDLNMNMENGAWTGKEDYYDVLTAVGNAIGDGQLSYPGAPYELDMPIGTRRLEALRDGMEEYELWKQVKDIYENLATSKGIAVDFDKVYDYITAKLFDHVNIIATADAFNLARKYMFELLALAKSDAKFALTDIDLQSNKLVGKAFVKDGYTLQINGATANGQTVNGGKIYDFEIDFTNYMNSCELKIPELSGFNTITLNSVGKAELKNAATSDFTRGKAAVTAEQVSAASAGITDAISENLIKLGVAATEGNLQSVKFVNSVVTSLGTKTSAIKFTIWNKTTKEYKLALDVKYEKDDIINTLQTITLKPGKNEITLSGLDQKSWDTLGKVEYFQLVFGDTKYESAVDGLYFDGYYVTYLE